MRNPKCYKKIRNKNKISVTYECVMYDHVKLSLLFKIPIFCQNWLWTHLMQTTENISWLLSMISKLGDDDFVNFNFDDLSSLLNLQTYNVEIVVNICPFYLVVTWTQAEHVHILLISSFYIHVLF